MKVKSIKSKIIPETLIPSSKKLLLVLWYISHKEWEAHKAENIRKVRKFLSRLRLLDIRKLVYIFHCTVIHIATSKSGVRFLVTQSLFSQAVVSFQPGMLDGIF